MRNGLVFLAAVTTLAAEPVVIQECQGADGDQGRVPGSVLIRDGKIVEAGRR